MEGVKKGTTGNSGISRLPARSACDDRVFVRFGTEIYFFFSRPISIPTRKEKKSDSIKPKS